MTSIVRHAAATVILLLALSGCATRSLESLKDSRYEETKVSDVEQKAEQRTRHSAEQPAPKAAEPPAVQTADDGTAEKLKWCGQRFIDYQDGKRPGGAVTVEQKQADDRLCEELKRGQIETGSIPKQ